MEGRDRVVPLERLVDQYFTVHGFYDEILFEDPAAFCDYSHIKVFDAVYNMLGAILNAFREK